MFTEWQEQREADPKADPDLWLCVECFTENGPFNAECRRCGVVRGLGYITPLSSGPFPAQELGWQMEVRYTVPSG
eukprot:jgi/Botrbrau1/22857/Bobra.0065s0015.1